MPVRLPSRYVVGRELGRGGMGIVYEAEDERLGRKVAIKVLHTGPESPERARRFAQEARAASALNHPNIITIHDIDTADAGDFIMMELVDGVPLSRLSHDGPMAIDRAVDYAMQIAGALAASHAADIVHRDLKPANVMVTPEGRIKWWISVSGSGLPSPPRGRRVDCYRGSPYQSRCDRRHQRLPVSRSSAPPPHDSLPRPMNKTGLTHQTELSSP